MPRPTEENGAESGSRARGGRQPPPAVDLPATVSLERTELAASPIGYRTAAPKHGQLSIRSRQSSRTGVIALAVSAMAVVGWGLVLAAILLHREHHLPELFVVVVTGLAALVPMFMGLSLVINRTIVTASDGRLRARRGPLPPWGARDVPAEAVQQLYFARDLTGSVPTYSVYARIDGEAPLLVAEGLRTPEQARYVEQAIEEHLGKEDPSLLRTV